jgi:DNA polymerase elongation subunit (family B)
MRSGRRTTVGKAIIVNREQRLGFGLIRATTLKHEREFFRGERDAVVYRPFGVAEGIQVLDRYYPHLVNGTRYIITFDDKGYTLTLESYERMHAALSRALTGGLIEKQSWITFSDMEWITSIEAGINKFKIEKFPERAGNAFNFHTGEFFPYVHTHPDDHISQILDRLGCWTSIDPNNYKENCLWLAFKDAGVCDKVLEAMRVEFKQRKIARKNIHKIAAQHNIYVTIRTIGDKNKLRYGPKDGYPVELALIKEHYIHNFRTDVCSYAFKNYDDLKHKCEWWRFYKKGERANRGVDAIDLIQLMMSSAYLTPISAVTSGIFRTQYHDQVDMDHFETLEYDDKYAIPKHPPRNGKGPCLGTACSTYKGCDAKMLEKIERARCNLDVETLTWLDDKFTKTEMYLEEQLAYLKRHQKAVASYAFDFEACSTSGKHKPYMVCFKPEDGPVEEHVGFDCAKKFLDTIVKRHGVAISTDTNMQHLKPPMVKLRAHNLTYDYSFIAEHIHRPNLIERGTNIITGTVRYYCKTGHATNGCNGELRKWMQTVGERIYTDRGHDTKAWKAATVQVNKTTEYLADLDACRKLGFGDDVWDVLATAPWGSMEETTPFYLLKAIDIKLQDTYKMIPEPLSKFGKMFNLDQAKEVMPYELYTEQFVSSGGVATWEQIKACKTFDDFETLRDNLHKWGCVQRCELGDRYDMMRYALIYCRADVEVLQKGWRAFAEMSMSELGMCTDAYPTIASLADAYYIECGIYDGVYEKAGVPLKFHSNASVGGRVMCANNTPSSTTEEMDDTDANSLYPSAQIRLGGFLKGRPKVWNESINLDECDGYCVKIRVTHIERNLRFPICRLKTKEGGCDWTNDLVGKSLTVDKWTLEDLVKYQGAKYEVLQGYYHDEGRQERLSEVVKDLFDRRQRYKASGNPLQIVLKIALNSAYGICGLKPIDTDTKYIQPCEKDNFILNHANHIKCIVEMPNGDYRFDIYKEIDTHYNRQHCAMEVLSMSKVIMNEVMCLAEDIGIDIAYQDTDSMHVPRKDSKRLALAYESKYDKSLLGDGQGSYGKFSSDFDFGDAWHFRDGKFRKVQKTVKPVGEVRAVRSIFLGKKSYIDELADEAGNVAWHMRMKGIPSTCMLETVAAKFKRNPMILYEHLLRGNRVEFDLTSAGNCCFKTTKTHEVMTLDKMTREVGFPMQLDLDGFTP